MSASLSISFLQEVANLYSSKIQTTNVSPPQRSTVIVDVQAYTRLKIYTSQALRSLTLINNKLL